MDDLVAEIISDSGLQPHRHWCLDVYQPSGRIVAPMHEAQTDLSGGASLAAHSTDLHFGRPDFVAIAAQAEAADSGRAGPLVTGWAGLIAMSLVIVVFESSSGIAAAAAAGVAVAGE